ncbi:Reticulocalbin-1 [Heterocephalus glaber]|uniref:Reticulocalbin-1 n=1 Tax=Heterocephalus glaber TaxID=10181 RepID=G5BA29_HETGA|nr:Reticulocalbin-1 [Heterocephalus glaber]
MDSDGDDFVTTEELKVWIKRVQKRYIYDNVAKDGKLDREEIEHWIFPQDYDHTQAKARHLVYESDRNEDEKITKEEILDNWNMFVRSQATQLLLGSHQESRRRAVGAAAGLFPRGGCRQGLIYNSASPKERGYAADRGRGYFSVSIYWKMASRTENTL